MKKFRLLAITAFFGLSAFAANAQNNDNQLIGKAQGELAQCLAQARANGLEVHSGVNVIGTCPDGSELREVVFFGGPHCPPPRICPLFVISIGSVQFDCEGNVVSSSCGVTSEE